MPAALLEGMLSRATVFLGFVAALALVIPAATAQPEDPEHRDIRAKIVKVNATVGREPGHSKGFIIPITAVARIDSRGESRVRLGARITCWNRDGNSQVSVALAPRGQASSKPKNRAHPYRIIGFQGHKLEDRPRRCVFGFGLWNDRNQQVVSLPAYCFRPGQSKVPRCSPARTRIAGPIEHRE